MRTKIPVQTTALVQTEVPADCTVDPHVSVQIRENKLSSILPQL